MTEDKYKPPEPGPGDVAHTLAKAGISLIPTIGGPAVELFVALITPPLEKRRQAWMKEIGEALWRLESEKGFKLEDLQTNDMFIDTVMAASQVAIRASQEEKREALRNAILNAASPNPPEESRQQFFINLVDEFTVWHLRILKFFQDPREWARQNDHNFPSMITSTLNTTLLSAFPELEEHRSFYDQVWRDLYRRGLVSPDSLHGMISPSAALGRHATDLGCTFLRFIEEPEY